MNERIKQLALQAGATVCGGYTSLAAGSWSDTGDIDSHTLDVEKFAELIVRECYALVDYENKQFIKAQFKDIVGVEE
jgi:hypothetical protein